MMELDHCSSRSRYDGIGLFNKISDSFGHFGFKLGKSRSGKLTRRILIASHRPRVPRATAGNGDCNNLSLQVGLLVGQGTRMVQPA